MIRTVLIGIIRVYQAAISPLLPPACRFHPSCSEYAAQAIAGRGAWTGAVLAAWRVLRCQPWSEGGFDPVPARGWRHHHKPHPTP